MTRFRVLNIMFKSFEHELNIACTTVYVAFPKSSNANGLQF